MDERGRAYYIKDLEKTRPSLYDGTPYPNNNEGWIQEIKKKMNALNIPVCFRVGLTTKKIKWRG